MLIGSTDPLQPHVQSDRQYLVPGAGDNSIRLWAVATRSPGPKPLPGYTNFVNTLAFTEGPSVKAHR